MTQIPKSEAGVGENVADAIDNRARQAALLDVAKHGLMRLSDHGIASGDLLFLAEHANVELLHAIRDLNLHPITPEMVSSAHNLQRIRKATDRVLNEVGLAGAVVHEPTSKFPQPKQTRSPMVDVHLPE